MASQEEKHSSTSSDVSLDSDVADKDGSATMDKHRMHVADVVLIVIAILAFVAAVIGFVLYATSSVPSSAAAKVNDDYIEESEVSEWIAQYRAANGYTDDDDFASLLSSQGITVSEFRINVIDQLATNLLVNEQADRLGITATDDEIQAQIDASKTDYAFGDEDAWKETLEQYSMTEEGLYDQYRTNLNQAALLDREVTPREVSDDEALSYAQYYLADTTQKHLYRIMFVGDDAHSRAETCLESLQAIQDAGNLTADTFSEVAREYSDEQGVEETGGSYAWTGDGVMDADIYEILEYMSAGEMSGLESIDADDAIEILYCDETYAFPSTDDIDSLTVEDIPSSLLVTIKNAAADELWTVDCNDYLAQLLAEAKVTYYPIPNDAAYNVDLS